MPCDKSALLDFLEVLNEDLTRKITLVAAGGTAMTLLDLKPSSILTSQFPAVTCLSSSAPSKITPRLQSGQMDRRHRLLPIPTRRLFRKKHQNKRIQPHYTKGSTPNRHSCNENWKIKPKRHPRHRDMHQRIQNFKRPDKNKSNSRKPHIRTQRRRLPLQSKLGHNKILLKH